MTIEAALLDDPDWDIDGDWELDFAEPDNEEEAKANFQWVLDNNPTIDALSVVIRSYYGSTIDW